MSVGTKCILTDSDQIRIPEYESRNTLSIHLQCEHSIGNLQKIDLSISYYPKTNGKHLQIHAQFVMSVASDQEEFLIFSFCTRGR
jgi:hypothetical protein